MTDLPVITSPLLDLAGVQHAFFTRQGGVSTGIYEGLNVGLGSGDAPADVAENRRRAAAYFGVGPEALNTAYQIHSAIALIADGPWGDVRPEADGVATKRRGLVCGALAADCAPILFADPKARVVAAAHAGWKGALGGIVGATVLKMQELGARPADIVALPAVDGDGHVFQCFQHGFGIDAERGVAFLCKRISVHSCSSLN